MKKIDIFFNNKKIIITGHTGFKGTWLTLWLHLSGAKILGISKDIPTKPSLFEKLKLKKKIKDIRLDISNLNKLKKIFKSYQPDYVFHLAAQSLVKKSYEDPIKTFTTNTVGTLNIVESLKLVKKECVAVIITSDKSYKNLEIKRGYKEDDALGGFDPYSASKASAELVIQCYFESFLKHKKNIRIAVARAGNVIGGGDWSKNRLIPDCMKSWSKNFFVTIRSPNATRPWQHVFDALYGYITLAISLKKNNKLNGPVFNFGPPVRNNFKVIDVLKLMKKFWKKVRWKIEAKKNYHYESNLLKLNSNKANKILKWKPNLSFHESIKFTVNWYKFFYLNQKKIYNFSSNQIDEYNKKIK